MIPMIANNIAEIRRNQIGKFPKEFNDSFTE